MGTATVGSVRAVNRQFTRPLPVRVGRFLLKVIFSYGALLYFLMADTVLPALKQVWRDATFSLAIGLLMLAIGAAVLIQRVTKSTGMHAILRR